MHSATSKATPNIKIKKVKKRKALISKQRIELLTNSASKRIIAVINITFFYFFNSFLVMGNFNDPYKL